MLITSTTAKEGKTFCCVNLATLIAKAGKKVLLIDLDMHKPKLGEPFEIQDNYGVTSYLINQKSFDEVVNETNVKNLDAISCGSIPPNPSELILSAQVNSLIEEAKKRYDYVIIDTPPVGIISDALVLMKKTHINLYVLRASRAKKAFVRTAEEIKVKNNPSNFCFILNGVKKVRAEFEYGYGYGYGGYSEKD